MQKVINCPCGFIVKGDTDDELVERAHPMRDRSISRKCPVNRHLPWPNPLRGFWRHQ